MRQICKYIALCLMAYTLFGDDCGVISQETSRQLALYVHDKFGFAPNTPVVIKTAEIVPETCYRRVQFGSDNASQPFNLRFYLSPDQRFLTRDLLDTAVDVKREREWEEQRAASDLQGGDVPTLGVEAAPIIITVFSDFQCPFCKKEAEILSSEALSKDGAYRIKFRNFPLSIHPWARPAAEMAMCAYEQSNAAFWAVHNTVFGQQASIDGASVKKVVDGILESRADVNLAAYRSCVQEERGALKVQTDISLGQKLGVKSTPTVFINGIRWSGVIDIQQIGAIAKSISRP
jgi:protein-disulfide isomerase